MNEDSNTDGSVQSDHSLSINESSDIEAGENESSEEEESSEDESSSDLEDNIAFMNWLDESKDITNDMKEEKFQKYISEGMSEQDANEKAHRKIMWLVKRNFFDRFKDYLKNYIHLKDNDTYQEVLADLEEKLEKGMVVDKALRRVIPMHRTKFDALFTLDEEDEEEEKDEDDED